MLYRLQLDLPLDGELKRAAEEQIKAVAGYLLNRKIYQARKSLKKVRALLRLIRPQLGVAYQEEDRRLRDIGRGFSAMRDTDVSLELIDRFSRLYKRKSTLNPQRKALLDRKSEFDNQPLDLTASLDALTGTLKRMEDWRLHGITLASLQHQVRKTHRQSCRAFQRALKTLTAEDFHSLRKSVKRELNQFRLLNETGSYAADLKQLNTLLGDHHNLAVMLTTLSNQSGRFRQMARKQQRLYESQVIALADRARAPLVLYTLIRSHEQTKLPEDLRRSSHRRHAFPLTGG